MNTTSEKLQIFQSANTDDSIAREEWHTYHPFTKSFNYSDEIEIVINQQDVFMDISQAEVYVEGKFKVLAIRRVEHSIVQDGIGLREQ